MLKLIEMCYAVVARSIDLLHLKELCVTLLLLKYDIMLKLTIIRYAFVARSGHFMLKLTEIYVLPLLLEV